VNAAQVPGDLVITSEHLGARLDDEGIDEFLRLLAKAGYEEIEIVVCVRPQDEMAALTHAGQVRSGRSEPFVVDEHSTWRFRYDFDILISRWESHALVAKTHVVLHRTRPEMIDSVDALLAILGIAPRPDSGGVTRDMTLAPSVLGFMRRLNRELDPSDGPIPGSVFEAVSVPALPRLSLENSRALLEAVEDANGFVLARVRPDWRVEGYFSPSGGGEEIEADFDIDDSVRFAGALWKHTALQSRRLQRMERDGVA
jgi:hypothetical protein